MANQIVARENELWPLRLLLTQQQLYARAKLAMGCQIAIVVIVPGALLVVQQQWPPARAWVALYGLVVALLDLAVLDSIKVNLRRKAALVQEWFDCEVLQLAWSVLRCGRRPDPEDVLLAGTDDPRFHKFRDWYSREVAVVPEHVGRIICQRSNCWWDSKQRRWYRYALLGLSGLVVIAVVVFALVQQRSLEEFILGFLAPTLPMVLWGIREARAQAEAADRADRLKTFGDEVWARALAGGLPPEAALTSSREFQDEILAHRRQSPLVFDWFHALLRPRFELQMGSSVKAMVTEAQAHGL